MKKINYPTLEIPCGFRKVQSYGKPENRSDFSIIEEPSNTSDLCTLRLKDKEHLKPVFSANNFFKCLKKRLSFSAKNKCHVGIVKSDSFLCQQSNCRNPSSTVQLSQLEDAHSQSTEMLCPLKKTQDKENFTDSLPNISLHATNSNGSHSPLIDSVVDISDTNKVHESLTQCDDMLSEAIYVSEDFSRSLLRNDSLRQDNSKVLTSSLGIPNSSEEPMRTSLTQELKLLSRAGWYWGPISCRQAEEKLSGQPDGAFLVRDSSDDRHLLSLSFRSCGKTYHTRIEYHNGYFSFSELEGHDSIMKLINHSMSNSEYGVYCYSRRQVPGSLPVPVQLTQPISRLTQVRSLQYLCRFVIRQYTRLDHINLLPLPQAVKDYIEASHY